MTKPFNPREAKLRDPFVAFACDEGTAALIRGVAASFGWAPDKVWTGGLRGAVQQLSVTASPTILFVDLSESADPLNDINALAEVCEPGTIVISAGMVNDVRLYRGLIASGVQDYLLKPFSEDQLRDAIAHAQMTLAMPQGEAPPARPHLMVAVIGARGGVGATSVAASCAWALSETNRRSTALLDLDVHFGTGALALDLEPGRGLTDAIENPERIDGLFIERAMVRASDTLAVLSAEAPISQPIVGDGDGDAFHHLRDELRQAFDCTVIDLPRGVLVRHPELLHEARAVVVVTEFTLAGARDTIRLLSWLKGNAPQADLIVAANKAVAGQPEISVKDFEGSIERAVDVIIPYDQKLAAQAARLGKPMVEAGKSSKTGHALAELAGRLGAMLEGEGKPIAKGGSLLGRLGDFRALLTKKT